MLSFRYLNDAKRYLSLNESESKVGLAAVLALEGLKEGGESGLRGSDVVDVGVAGKDDEAKVHGTRADLN